MFEKNESAEKYIRDRRTYEEELFEAHLKMRRILHEIENIKYEVEDKYMTSNEYKQGFLAGIKTMSSLLMDV